MLAVAVGLFALQITVLAFPQLLMTHSAQSGTVVIYARGGDTGAFRDLAERVDRRLQGSEFYRPSRTDRVYLFEDPGLYRLFVRLSLLRVEPQGYNLSIFGNSYISTTRHRKMADRTGGLPEYSIWDGDLSHLIAHEVAHQHVIDHIGRGTWKRLPHWKQEGIPEYIANIGPVTENGPPLAERVAILLDDRQWQATRGIDGAWGWDRIHYEAGLMVEYLIRQEGCTLDDIAADRIAAEDVRHRMIAWSRNPES